MDIENVKDLIYVEIRDVANGIRPKDSTQDMRHAPDGVLIEKLITEIIFPILTGLASGILTYLSTEYSNETDAEKIKLELKQTQLRLQAVEKEMSTKNDTNEILTQIATELHQIRTKLENPKVTQATSNEIVVTVTKVLEDYHLGQGISKMKAEIISTKIINSFERDIL